MVENDDFKKRCNETPAAYSDKYPKATKVNHTAPYKPINFQTKPLFKKISTTTR